MEVISFLKLMMAVFMILIREAIFFINLKLFVVNIQYVLS